MGFILTRFSTTNRRDSSRRRGERALWALLDGTARQSARRGAPLIMPGFSTWTVNCGCR